MSFIVISDDLISYVSTIRALRHPMSKSKLLPCHLLTVGFIELKSISQFWPYVESSTSATSAPEGTTTAQTQHT